MWPGRSNGPRQELREAILAAVESGESYRDIAPYAGLSYTRVYQLAQQKRSGGAEPR